MVRIFTAAIKGLSKVSVFRQPLRPFLAAAAVGEGSRAIQRKEYDLAFRVLSPFAEDEIDDGWVAGCQWQLGYLYYHGLGITKNEEQAFSLFQKAARAGSSDAIDYLKRKNAYDKAGHSNDAPHPTL